MWCINSSLDDRPPDIVVNVGSCSFHSHKDILTNNCDYFKAMFSSQMLENSQDVITIKLIEKYPFEVLLQGFYSRQLLLNVDNIFEVTLAAHILQVSDCLFNQCCDFMKSVINPRKCFEIMHFTKFHNLQKVYDASRRYCLIHFNTLYKEEAFLNLSIDQVINYLSDEYLVAEGEYERILALAEWCDFNKFSDSKILHEAIVQVLNLTTNNSPQLCEQITRKFLNQEKLNNDIMHCLNSSILCHDLMMFWARLSDSEGEGLVDVVKLVDLDGDIIDVKGMRVDSMTELVEKPGFDLGSAVCGKGPYVYVCGGGPNFGRMDWIRDIWRYSVLKDKPRWNAVGKLPHPLRYHTVIPAGSKLYIFGGFGKFRSKNCNLNSFDVSTGSWNQHTDIPKWGSKPVATYHHHYIYYVCHDWNIHVYNTILDQWITLESSDPVCDISINENRTEHCKPISCFVSPASVESSLLRLIILSQGNHFQTHSLKINLNSKSFSLFKPKKKHNVDLKSLAYLGSCVLADKIAILFKKISIRDMDNGDSEIDDLMVKECTPIHVMYFSPDMGELKGSIQVNNVEKTLSVVVVPKVPNSFPITSQSSNKEGILLL